MIMDTFCIPKSIFEWIQGLQRAVELGFLTKEEMESAIKLKYGQ